MSAMIHQLDSSWQSTLKNIITQPEELFRLLKLDQTYLPQAERASQLFPLRVTYPYLKRIEIGNIYDPLLLQILPLHAELIANPEFSADPLQEKNYNPLPGLLHKYHGRVLLMVSGACAIHCRYCFRREFPYHENNPGLAGWQPVIDYIAKNPDIEEVIYSGGDPLVVKDHFLEKLSYKIAAIPHVQRLRIHTRLPIVIPQRINDEFLTWFKELPLQKIMVIHCNHPQEVDADVALALEKLLQINTRLFNQLVLLKGINDDLNTQINLHKKLFAYGVSPYYLNFLDKVSGVSHFAVDKEHALALVQQLQSRLPGYLVPKLVQEIPGELNKVTLF